MRILIVSILITIFLAGLLTGTVSAFSPGDVQWADSVSSTLHKNGVLTVGNYTIEAVEFSSPVRGIKNIKDEIVPETPVAPSVILRLSRDGTFLQDLLFTPASDAYISPDYEIKIYTKEFLNSNAKEWTYQYYDPWASVNVQLRGTPELEVSISTDESSYTSTEDYAIKVTVDVKNSGSADARDVNLVLDPAGLVLRSRNENELKEYFHNVLKDETRSFNMTFEVPVIFEDMTITLIAKADGRDIKDILYKGTAEKSVVIQAKQDYLAIHKSVYNYVYLKDIVPVMISLKNNGISSIYSINLTDQVSASFELKNNKTTQWFIPELKPDAEWSTTYYLKPMEVNLDGHVLPEATAEFTMLSKNYSSHSEAPKVIVNGPKLILNKTASNLTVHDSNLTVRQGEEINITVTLENTGNMGTRIEATDEIPVGAVVVRGNISLEKQFLDRNSKIDFSYVLKVETPGEVILPPVAAYYTEQEHRGELRAAKSSDILSIKVLRPEEYEEQVLNRTADVTPAATAESVGSNTSGPGTGDPTVSGTQPASEQTKGVAPGFEIISVISVLSLIYIFKKVLYRGR